MSEKKSYGYNLGLIFYQIVEVFSDNVALRYVSGENISYGELNNRSNQISRFLLQQGIIKGDVVAIFNDKSSDAFAALLACLKIGAIYTNLDPENPFSRTDKILDTCRAKLVLNFFPELAKSMDNFNLDNKVIVDAYQDEFKQQSDFFDDNNLTDTFSVTGSDPAYIVFTSGSTGFPKGALMSHDNVKNFIEWSQSTFNITPSDRLTNVNPIYFDNSVFDIYSSLFSGACLSPISSAITSVPHKLVKALTDMHCTLWFSVPSLLVYLLTTKVLTKDCLPSMRAVIFGGEGFPKTKLKELFVLLGDRAKLINVYGPTECTCICSSYTISEDDFSNMQELASLGQIANNFAYLILDDKGIASNQGELYLSGPCVGMGYYNDEELTQAAFIQEPKNKAFRQLLYRTGDLVEQKKDKLYFIGRKDNQIKHMGFRIELEEIESIINSLVDVIQCAVFYVTQEPFAGKILAAVVLNNARTEQELMHSIKPKLPGYMMPKRLILLEQLPKNRNGKVDRNALKQRYYNL